MAAPDGPDLRTRRVFLLAALLHALAYFFAVGPWMGEDEPWHFEYASHVASGHLPWNGGEVQVPPKGARDDRREWSPSALQTYRRFHALPYQEIAQRQREILDSMAREHYFERVDWAGAVRERSDFDQIFPMFTASNQSPSYYLLLGAWLAVGPTSSIEGDLMWGRVLSLVLYLVTAWAAWEFAQHAFSDRWLALAAAVAIAWFPMSVRQAAVINNDVLARTMGALVLMYVARAVSERGDRTAWVLAIVATILALSVKTTNASLAIVLDVALLLRTRGRLRWAIVAVTLLALAGWVWILRNNPAVPKNFDALFLRISNSFTLETLTGIGKTLVGEFNWSSREMGAPIYVAFAAIGALALASSFFALIQTPSGVSRRMLITSFVAVAVQLSLIVLRGNGHGRYLMPVWPAIAMLVVVGLVARVHPYWRSRVAGLFVLGFVLYDALFLWGELVPNEYLLWGS